MSAIRTHARMYLLVLVALLIIGCGSQDVVVDEPLPGAQADAPPAEATPEEEMDDGMSEENNSSEDGAAMDEEEAMAGEEMAENEEPMTEDEVEPTAEPTAEPTPEPTATPSGPTTLGGGTFRAADNTVSATGTATLLQLEDGSRILRFEEFEVSPGPDLYVILVPRADVTSEADNTGYVDLGLLKGNIGDQNYEIPSDLDVSGEWTAVVWCKEFDHNFGIAPLN